MLFIIVLILFNYSSVFVVLKVFVFFCSLIIIILLFEVIIGEVYIGMFNVLVYFNCLVWFSEIMFFVSVVM